MNTGGTINGELNVNNALRISKISGTSPADFISAALKVSSRYNINSSSRPGITLENDGLNACMIFLDIDGDVKVVFHNGTVKKISLI